MLTRTKGDECYFRINKGSTKQKSFELDISTKPYQTKENFAFTVMIWCGACADGLKFKSFEEGQTMNSDRYIATLEWYHEQLINDGYSAEYLARYRYLFGFIPFLNSKHILL